MNKYQALRRSVEGTYKTNIDADGKLTIVDTAPPKLNANGRETIAEVDGFSLDPSKNYDLEVDEAGNFFIGRDPVTLEDAFNWLRIAHDQLLESRIPNPPQPPGAADAAPF